VNSRELRKELLENGVGLSSSSDTEVIAQMLAGAEGKDTFERLKNAMLRWKGAYSLVVLTIDGGFVARDPWGVHPLSVGLLPSGGHAPPPNPSHSTPWVALASAKYFRVNLLLEQSCTARRTALSPKNPTSLCTFANILLFHTDIFWDGRSDHIFAKPGKSPGEPAPIEPMWSYPCPNHDSGSQRLFTGFRDFHT
jgi:amidophosphoribosyltransferase